MADDTEQRISASQLGQAFLRGAGTSTRRSGVGEATAYQKHAWVYSCVTAICRTVAAIPFRVSNKKGKVLTDGPVVDLMRRPSPRKSRYELWFGTMMALELTGNAIWWVDRGKSKSRKALPVGLHLLDTRNIKLVRNQDDGQLVGYEYKQGKGKTMFSPDEVIHFQYPNSSDPAWGMAPLTAAMTSVRTDVKVGAYNEQFFENGAVLGGLLINKRGVGREQLDQMRSAFEGEYGGHDGAHRTAILSGDWDYKPFSIGQREMEFMEQRRFAREQVGAVFGVPGILTNDPNRSNYSTANVELKVFAETNWLPKVRYLEDVLDAQLFMRYYPKYHGSFDVSEAPGLRDDLGQKIDRAVSLGKLGVPLNQLITEFSLPFEPVAWGDEWWVQASMFPATHQLEVTQSPTADDTSDSDKVTDSIFSPVTAKGALAESVAVGVIADPVRERYWRSYVRSVSLLESRFQSRFKRFCYDIRKALVAYALNEDQVPVIGDFDVMGWAMPYIEEAVREGVVMANGELGVCRNDLADSDCRSAIECSSGSVAEVGSLMMGQVAEFITSAEKGEEVADKVRGVFSVLANRAKDIARVEVGGAVIQGRVWAMQQHGVGCHEWISSRDAKRTCEHLCDGEIREIGVEFSNGLRWPYDTGVTSLDNVCRCVTIPVG